MGLTLNLSNHHSLTPRLAREASSLAEGYTLQSAAVFCCSWLLGTTDGADPGKPDVDCPSAFVSGSKLVKCLTASSPHVGHFGTCPVSRTVPTYSMSCKDEKKRLIRPDFTANLPLLGSKDRCPGSMFRHR
jgi:hypothetical protein